MLYFLNQQYTGGDLYRSILKSRNIITIYPLTPLQTVWSGKFLRTPMYPPVLLADSTRSPYGENISILYVDSPRYTYFSLMFATSASVGR